MPVTVEVAMNYIIGTTAIMIIVLLYIGYSIFKLKRMIKKQIAYENQSQGY